MKPSPYFADLVSTYAYEIEDLTYDSGGDDVLARRLADKRGQFGELLRMCASDPVMVAPALHGAFRFLDTEVLDRLVAGGPDDLPAWESVAPALQAEAWAKPLVRQALASDGGGAFLVVAAGLEYLLGRLGAAGASAGERGGEGEEDDAAGDDDEDLGDAGEDWLGEQGFDRRS